MNPRLNNDLELTRLLFTARRGTAERVRASSSGIISNGVRLQRCGHLDAAGTEGQPFLQELHGTTRTETSLQWSAVGPPIARKIVVMDHIHFVDAEAPLWAST